MVNNPVANSNAPNHPPTETLANAPNPINIPAPILFLLDKIITSFSFNYIKKKGNRQILNKGVKSIMLDSIRNFFEAIQFYLYVTIILPIKRFYNYYFKGQYLEDNART